MLCRGEAFGSSSSLRYLKRRMLRPYAPHITTPALAVCIRNPKEGEINLPLSLQILPLLRIEATPKSVKLKFAFVLSLSKDEANAIEVCRQTVC
jgi:hypothetical protein